MENWDVIEEVGGEAQMEALMRAFYDRLFEDIMVGYLFEGKDKEHLVRSQITYVHANLGSRQGSYEGPSIRRSHEKLAILPGHFDRRHQILKDVLHEYEVPEKVCAAWLGLDQAMRPMVLGLGEKARGEGAKSCRH